MENRQKHIKYQFQTIFEAIISNGDANKSHIANVNIKFLSKNIEHLKNELSNRGKNYRVIDDYYEYIEYSLKRLSAYFESNDNMNQKDAYIFASFLSYQVELLEERVMV